jgi:hypothetical protein
MEQSSLIDELLGTLYNPQKYWGLGCNQGPVVTFSLKRADGSWVGHREVEKLAALENIQLRVRLVLGNWYNKPIVPSSSEIF